MKPDNIRRLERRKKTRFPICRELRYKLVEGQTVLAQGTGETIDLGSGGIAFRTGQTLKTGCFAELSIAWPALLGENTLMRLVVFGRVLRSQNGVAVCTVDKYEFRTQARLVPMDARPRQDSMLERWVAEFRKEGFRARRASA